MVGCVDAVDGGLKLVSAGKHESYALEGLNGLQPGTKVRVKGKEQTDGDGKKTFVVNKLVKEYGPCEKYHVLVLRLCLAKNPLKKNLPK